MAFTTKQRIEIQANKLRAAFLARIADPVQRWTTENNKNNLPTVTFTDMARVLVEQEDFIQREELVADMLRFYMVNPLDFMCIVSKDLRTKCRFNEEKADYLWESMNDIAVEIESGAVYLAPNGIFEAWRPGKKNGAKVLTVKAAAKICGVYFDGAI